MYQKERGSIFSINGDEILDGPFYNYARCGTWSYLANTIIQEYVKVVFVKVVIFSLGLQHMFYSLVRKSRQILGCFTGFLGQEYPSLLS